MSLGQEIFLVRITMHWFYLKYCINSLVGSFSQRTFQHRNIPHNSLTHGKLVCKTSMLHEHVQPPPSMTLSSYQVYTLSGTRVCALNKECN